MYHIYQSAEIKTTVSVSGILRSQYLTSVITIQFLSCILFQVLKVWHYSSTASVHGECLKTMWWEFKSVSPHAFVALLKLPVYFIDPADCVIGNYGNLGVLDLHKKCSGWYEVLALNAKCWQCLTSMFFSWKLNPW